MAGVSGLSTALNRDQGTAQIQLNKSDDSLKDQALSPKNIDARSLSMQLALDELEGHTDGDSSN
jgi:hypothetical protein